MKKTKLGFTLVEVSLFLAVTALLFLGVMMGVRSSIYQQRYNDSVQNFADFLRGLYSEVSNVEHSGNGMSNKAVYGKLVTFGEGRDLNGTAISSTENRVFVYTVIGDIGEIGYGGTVDGLTNLRNALRSLNVNVIIEDGGTYKYVGIAREYVIRWQAGIQTTAAYGSGYNKYNGSILIVRHPRSGTIHTLVSNNVIQVNNAVKSNTGGSTLLTSQLNSFSFSQKDFCINPLGNAKSNQRRNIKLASDARNASGVRLIDQDSAENSCL